MEAQIPAQEPEQPVSDQEAVPSYPQAIQSFGNLPSVEEFFHSQVMIDEENQPKPESDGSFRILIPDREALERFGNLTRDYSTLLNARENLTLIVAYLEQLAPYIMAKTGMERGSVIDFHKLGGFLQACVFNSLELENAALQAEAQPEEVPTMDHVVGEEPVDDPDNVVPFGGQA